MDDSHHPDPDPPGHRHLSRPGNERGSLHLLPVLNATAGPSPSPRVALLGGSFDPPHRGHLHVARSAREELELHRVLLLPAWQPPHKHTIAPAHHRLAMARLLAAEEPFLGVDEHELDRGGTSYTFDTVQEILREQRPAALFFLIGADSLEDLPGWYRAGELVRTIQFVTVPRGSSDLAAAWKRLGTAFPPDVLESLRRHVLDVPPLPVSSTEVRARLGRSEDAADLLTPPVLAYIREHHLYGT